MSQEDQRTELAKLIANAVCETLSIRDAQLVTSITGAVATHTAQNAKDTDKGAVYAKTPQLSIPKIDDPKMMNIEARVRSFIRYRDELLLYFTAAYKHGDALHKAMVTHTDRIYKTWLTAKSEHKAIKVNEVVQAIKQPKIGSLEEFISKCTPSILDGIPKNVRSDINIGDAEKPYQRLLFIHFNVMRAYTITNRDHLARFKEYVAKGIDVAVAKEATPRRALILHKQMVAYVQVVSPFSDAQKSDICQKILTHTESLMTPSDRLRLAITAEEVGLQEFEPDQAEIQRVFETLEQILMKSESLPSTKTAAFWAETDSKDSERAHEEKAMKADAPAQRQRERETIMDSQERLPKASAR